MHSFIGGKIYLIMWENTEAGLERPPSPLAQSAARPPPLMKSSESATELAYYVS